MWVPMCGFSRYLPAWIQRSVSFNHQARCFHGWFRGVVAEERLLNPQRRIPTKSYEIIGGFCIFDRLLMFFCILFGRFVVMWHRGRMHISEFRLFERTGIPKFSFESSFLD